MRPFLLQADLGLMDRCAVTVQYMALQCVSNRKQQAVQLSIAAQAIKKQLLCCSYTIDDCTAVLILQKQCGASRVESSEAVLHDTQFEASTNGYP